MGGCSARHDCAAAGQITPDAPVMGRRQTTASGPGPRCVIAPDSALRPEPAPRRRAAGHQSTLPEPRRHGHVPRARMTNRPMSRNGCRTGPTRRCRDGADIRAHFRLWQLGATSWTGIFGTGEAQTTTQRISSPLNGQISANEGELRTASTVASSQQVPRVIVASAVLALGPGW